MNNNRRCDVLIEDSLGTGIIVWADGDDIVKLIESIDGVAQVSHSFSKGKYYVEIDARYYRSAVEEKIKSKVMTKNK